MYPVLYWSHCGLPYFKCKYLAGLIGVIQDLIGISCSRQNRCFCWSHRCLGYWRGREKCLRLIGQVWRGRENLWFWLVVELMTLFGNCDSHTLHLACEPEHIASGVSFNPPPLIPISGCCYVFKIVFLCFMFHVFKCLFCVSCFMFLNVCLFIRF